MNKTALTTALYVVGLVIILNQFDATERLLNGGNKFFR